MDFDKLRQYLNVIKISVDKIEQIIGEVPSVDTKGIPVIDTKGILDEVNVPVPKKIAEDTRATKTKIKAFDLDAIQYNDKWPTAVPPYAISAESELGHRKRAKGVLDAVSLQHIEGNFLDFGCGEGYITAEAVKRGASKAVGFDIVPNAAWEGLQSEQVEFTDDYEKLSEAKFDVIFLYDVLDHSESPTEILSQIKEVLAEEGCVYVRCHPYTSKHATHVYKTINKAYLHFFASAEDLKSANPIFTQKILDPVKTYAEWFKDFNVMSQNVIRESVNEFFLKPDMKRHIGEHGLDSRKIDVLEIQFIDYVLKLK